MLEKLIKKPYPILIIIDNRKKEVSIGELLTSVNKIKLLIQQPRQAWNVYGINIKNTVVGSVTGKISATKINLTKPGNSGQPQQGTTNRVTVITDQG